MANQSKPPLKLVVSGSNFHKELSLHQRIKLHWSEPLESHIRNFSSGCGVTPMGGGGGGGGGRPAPHPGTEIPNMALEWFRPMQFCSLM